MAQPSTPSALLRTRVEALTDQLPLLAEGHVDAIHRTRVASRRLREAIPIAFAERDTAKNLGRRLRAVNRVLGPIRELDVMADLIAELEQSSGYSVAAVGRAVARARKGAGGRLESCARKLGKLSSRLDDTVADLQHKESANLRKVNRNWSWAIQARVVQRSSRVQRAMDRAGVLYASGPLHDVRVSIKKLRYAMELADEMGESHSAAVQTLKRAQDLLGRQHDLETLRLWGRQVQLSAPRRANWRELASLSRAIEKDCRELHAIYMGERPALTALIVRIGANIQPQGGAAVRHAVG